MKIGIGQINTRIGDFSANAKKIEEACRSLAKDGAEFAVFPECCVSGYPLKDLASIKKFIESAQAALQSLSGKLPIPAIVGCPRLEHGSAGVRNSAYLIDGGSIKKICDKHLLPNYGALNDARIFDPGSDFGLVKIRGKSIGVTICEDIWTIPSIPTAGRYEYFPRPLEHFANLKKSDPSALDILVNISASVFSAGNDTVRRKGGLMCEVSRFVGVPLVWCNLVGGNDEIVFAGGGGFFDASGAEPKSKCLKKFEECAEVIDTSSIEGYDGDSFDFSGDADLKRAIVMALRDFVNKCGIKKVLVGLSGGIDSALVAALAVEALGSSRVCGISMPSKFSSGHSKTDAAALAENLGIEYRSVSIESPVAAVEGALSEIFAGLQRDVAEENIQSRMRGLILMAVSNKFGALVLTTGNKSECAVGYCTLYGDTNGGFAPICDLYKTEVYRISNLVNREAGREIIPQNTIDKPPSAELRPDQKDEDSLPPYDILDAVLRMYVEEGKSAEEIAAKGFDAATVADVIGKVSRAEYKRSQYPIGPKLSTSAFSTDRIIPVSAKKGMF